MLRSITKPIRRGLLKAFGRRSQKHHFAVIGGTANDYLQVVADQGDIASEDFTIFANGYLAPFTERYAVIWSQDRDTFSTPFYNIHVRLRDNGNIEAFFNSNTNNIIQPHGLSLGDFYRIRIRYQPGSQSIMVNSTVVGTSSFAGPITFNAGVPAYIGRGASNFTTAISTVHLESLGFFDHTTGSFLVKYGSRDWTKDLSGNGRDATIFGNVQIQ